MNGDLSKPRILIVDDEPNICFILERTLRSDGYNIQTATDGQSALRLIQQQMFDLLLLDLNMSPVSGIQVMNQLRQIGHDSVVIILTAHSTIESAVEALRLGAFDYLFKPATPEAIRARVSAGLQHREQSLKRQRLLSQIEQLKSALALLDADSPPSPTTLPDRFLRSGPLVIDKHHRSATLNGQLLDLTTTEFNLLACLVHSAPEAVGARRLVQEALNYDSEEMEARELIKWHIHHLRQKVEPDPENPKFIKTVRYKGYLWSG